MVIKINYTSSDVYVSTSVSPVYVVVNYSAVNNGGGGAIWGGITGTLSDQTDLQDALDDKVPYTGATANVNLGEYELKAGQMTLDTTPTGTAAVGTTRWNDTIGSSETTLKGGSVILKNGVDLVARVVNKISPNTTLTKAAYQAVRVSGAQGQRLAVALAQANNDANSADTIGLVTETIATNQEGFIMTVGQLENINTTGSLQGETWADGDVLYLSPTTAGAITKVKPTGNGHIVVIGYVEYAHANNGKIYVKVMNGWELDELHDVAIVSPANNEALIYESSTSLWKNKTIATALGYTPVPTTRTLTINGTAFDLSADRSWTIPSANIYNADGTLTGNRSLTHGGFNLTFIGGTHTNRFTSAGRLLLGTTTESTFIFDAVGTARISGALTLGNGATITSGGLLVQSGGANITGALVAGSIASSHQIGNFQIINSGNASSTGLGISSADSAFQFQGYTAAVNTTYPAYYGFRHWNNSALQLNTATQGIIRLYNIGFLDGNTNSISGNTLWLQPIYNFTGTRTGIIVRGFYYDPVLTSITNTTHRAIETVSGDVLLGTTSGSVGVGANTSINASAILDVTSTTKGVLFPRMTTTQKNAISSPAAGLQVYDTTLNQMSYYNGTTWVNF